MSPRFPAEPLQSMVSPRPASVCHYNQLQVGRSHFVAFREGISDMTGPAKKHSRKAAMHSQAAYSALVSLMPFEDE